MTRPNRNNESPEAIPLDDRGAHRTGTAGKSLILIVDDEQIGLESLSSLLDGLEYELLLASSGSKAIELAEERLPDLILLDVMMPGMDGFEVCRRLRQLPKTAEVPILLVTALDDQASRLEGLEAGADDFLSRPFDRAEVRARVRTITRLNRSNKRNEEIAQSPGAKEGWRENSRRLEQLRLIDRSLLRSGSSEAIAAGVLPLIQELVPFRYAAIFLREPRGSVTLLAERGEWREPVPPLAHLDPFRVDVEASQSPVPVDHGGLPRMRPAGGGLAFAVPLVLQDHALGVLVLASESLTGFDEAAIAIVQEVGGLISLALDHAALLKNVARGRGQLEWLSRKLFQAREQESRRIARELHDEVGQILAVLNFSMSKLKLSVAEEPDKATLTGCLELVAQLLAKVRGLSVDLHPSLLDDFGVVTALRRHVESLTLQTGLDLSFEADEAIERPGQDVEMACYRVVQEALANAIRHSGSSRVLIRLQVRGRVLEATVEDDGTGFDPNAMLEQAGAGSSLGLLGMKVRVSLVGGELVIRSTHGVGTEVCALFPLAPE